ncbi:MAG: hypothetical protein LH702_32945 [Phormidesmis sp. CAN_BIN44]|nr:hypothetical protein [Phormidesmis sp. CAN_BIN44]
MLSAASQSVAQVPCTEGVRVSISNDDRGSGRICGNCLHFRDGLCLTRAAAEWENPNVSPKREACFLASIIPF